MPDPVGQRLQTADNGAYQLYELVAAGAFGSVYFGRDLGNNRAVAIKKLHPHWARDPRAVERFNQEAQSGRELKHPNVVQLLDQGTDPDGIPFIVLQWVEGWTVAALLERHLKQVGAFPIDEAVEIAWQTLAGLEAARRLGLVHRDIKPLNLMVTPPPEQQVKVMDFGIAKDVLAAVTGDNTQVGTLAYMSPEQFTGAAVDTRTDLYALGVTLYELLAGQRPFLGPTTAAYVHQHLYETPLPLRQLRPEVDAALAATVHRALARQPDDRFQLPTEMQAALHPFTSPAQELTMPAEAPAAYQVYPTVAPTPPPEAPTVASHAAPDGAAPRPVGDLRRASVFAAIGIGIVVLVGFLWHPWSTPTPGPVVPTLAPTAAAANTLAPLVAPTTAPPATLAASSVVTPTPAASSATAIAKSGSLRLAAAWQVLAVGLSQANGIAVDDRGNIYVANSDNNHIQKLSAAGQPLFEWGSDWGPAPGQFEAPFGVAVDAAGNIYVADRDNDRIQKLSGTGEPVAQWGAPGSGPGQFHRPTAVDIDALGNIYVVDAGNDRIQKLSATGVLLGQWGTSGPGPGQFSNPMGVAVDGRGNVYVADSGNDRIQKLSASGAPLAQWGTSGRGAGQFSNPTGVAVDAQGTVYVTDRGNARIQELSATGQPLIQWGSFNNGSGPGQFSNPFGIAIDALGNVYVTDRDNQRIQKLPAGN